ncbi:MAG: putative Glycogen synthase kinase-3 [Streblomastix strix]|uniref:Putative Glycogen synthase kinase-3 n=1 Tax=Streblomastix strix TaxID=222440 RepID=A0A5J4VIZ6_9EUKA|nr:MAG: putative Glycogen synthase kinase-3 [Streblomastix strix]
MENTGRYIDIAQSKVYLHVFEQIKRTDYTTNQALENKEKSTQKDQLSKAIAMYIQTMMLMLHGASDQKDFEYSTEKIIGRGSFGVVVQGTLHTTGETVAIKKVQQERRYKNRELSVMQLLNHPNCVNLKGYFYTQEEPDKQFMNVVMEYLPQTLYHVIHHFTKQKKALPPFYVQIFAYQLCRSLAYIHGKGLCHRDIKPQNLLVDTKNGALKLCDFGSAKFLSSTDPSIAYICSRYYRAPELIFGAQYYGTAVDIWSTGCVLAEMLIGRPFFPGESSTDQMINIIKIIGTPTEEERRDMLTPAKTSSIYKDSDFNDRDEGNEDLKPESPKAPLTKSRAKFEPFQQDQQQDQQKHHLKDKLKEKMSEIFNTKEQEKDKGKDIKKEKDKEKKKQKDKQKKEKDKEDTGDDIKDINNKDKERKKEKDKKKDKDKQKDKDKDIDKDKDKDKKKDKKKDKQKEKEKEKRRQKQIQKEIDKETRQLVAQATGKYGHIFIMGMYEPILFDMPVIQKKPWDKVLPSYSDKRLIDLISKMLIYSPEKRITALEV